MKRFFMFFALLLSSLAYAQHLEPAAPPLPGVEQQEKQALPEEPNKAEKHATKDVSFFDKEPFGGEEAEGSRFFQEFMHMLSILGIMIAVLLIVAWLLKKVVAGRMVQGNISSAIKIIDRRGLTTKTAIYLIEVENQRLLIAESSNGASLLCNFSANTAAKRSFSEVLND